MTLILYISIIGIVIGILSVIFVLFDRLYHKCENDTHKTIIVIAGMTVCGIVLYSACVLMGNINEYEKQNIFNSGEKIMDNVKTQEMKK